MRPTGTAAVLEAAPTTKLGRLPTDIRAVARSVKPAAALTAALLAVVSACDESGRDPEPRFRVDAVGLELPKLRGWVRDASAKVEDPAKGGVVLRLVRKSAVAGSPRVDVVLEPLAPHATRLDTFLAQNQREMAGLETAGKIRIQQVSEKPVRVGPREAYRMRHEYTMGEGSNQVAITQVSTILVLDGRGVTVTAVGRTELFHPLADAIDRILSGIETPATKRAPSDLSVEHVEPTPSPEDKTAPPEVPTVEPVDLGKIGGED